MDAGGPRFVQCGQCCSITAAAAALHCTSQRHPLYSGLYCSWLGQVRVLPCMAALDVCARTVQQPDCAPSHCC